MRRNLIIRASAGTGKTFALATRFIGLMLFQNVPPERILALTFSRAAAQEIYMKLLERLWKAASDEAGATEEKRILLERLEDDERAKILARVTNWSPSRFADLLRRVIAVQHYGTIATLDSFILRIVRSFPLEMGFQNAVDVLDEFGENRAINESRIALLNRGDAAQEVIAAYQTAIDGEFSRTCMEVLEKAIEGWRPFMLAHRAQCADWTPASMRKALGVPDELSKPDLSALRTFGRTDPRASFARHLDGFSPTDDIFERNIAGDLARHLIAHPGETAYSYTTSGGRTKVVECGAAGAKAIRDGVRYMLGLKLARSIDVVAAKLALCRMIEAEYDASTRRRGLLTFADFTTCQAVAEEDSEASLRLENLQFRFDSRFDHWALDEFQDTSALQWKCLKRLVREAAQPGDGRTVMVVGDLKQSIYTWRGGDDGPFLEMMNEWSEFRDPEGEIRSNPISHRYGKNTADFINRVFGPGNVGRGGVLGEACGAAIDRWLAKNSWMEHLSESKDGRAKAEDYVTIIGVEGRAEETVDDGSAAMKILAPKIRDLMVDLWASHEEARSTETIGVLVRKNGDGAVLAECLRGANLPVVWEGVDRVTDSPIVRAVLQLLWLAEHPQDAFAWTLVNDLLPVRRIVFPQIARQEKVSQELSGMLSRLGLSRTLREIIARLRAAEQRIDARSDIRLGGLMREAVSYEQRRDAAAGIGDFIAYLSSQSGRETSASPRVIRILTIHRAKGLTFDHAIVPISETGDRDSLIRPRQGAPLSGEGWAISALSEGEAMLNGLTAQAWRRAADDRALEQIRLNYVALTRARKSTHVFVCRDSHRSIQFRDFLLKPFAEEKARECSYGVRLCEFGTMPAFARREADESEVAAWVHAAGDARVTHRSPSAGEDVFGSFGRMRASALFDAGLSAAERGIAAHAAYAAIEWIDPERPGDDLERTILAGAWREAFVRPSAEAVVWRERPYELCVDGVWETGRFDRVVFTGVGEARRAVIYDFKTNARGADESEDGFARRMQETYSGQMSAYRAALARIVALPIGRIEAKMLLESTGSAPSCILSAERV